MFQAMGDNMDLLRQNLSLRAANSPAFASVLRLRSHLSHICHDFFRERHFLHVDTPILTRNDCEQGGDTFSLSVNASLLTQLLCM
jgi:asparaginyl-tRNA synthetase